MTLVDRDLSTATGPVLSDGTPVRSLVDYDKREVSTRLMTDPEIFRMELKNLWAKTWTMLGHESEIPQPGDFIIRQIGLDPVIVSRGRKMGISVLLNICTHRGMQICRAESGRASTFKCPYHGFSFTNEGRFVGAPIAAEQMHGDVMSKEELSLSKARVETYAGFIFATWDEDAESLENFLGEMKFYTDLMWDRLDGLEVLGPPQRAVMKANWKYAGEQHNVDAYHTISLHHSLKELELLAGDEETATGLEGGASVSANGHGIRCIDQRVPYIPALKDIGWESMSVLEKLTALPPAGMTADQVPLLQKRFNEDELRLLADCPPVTGGLFPNIGYFTLNMAVPGGVIPLIVVHNFVPLGPDRFEYYNWIMVEKSASAELREQMSQVGNLSFGISGFVETDDADTWPQMQKMAQGHMGSQQKLRYHALRGDTALEDWPGGWPGGGHVYLGFGKDDCQWQWWLAYFEKMLENA